MVDRYYADVIRDSWIETERYRNPDHYRHVEEVVPMTQEEEREAKHQEQEKSLVHTLARSLRSCGLCCSLESQVWHNGWCPASSSPCPKLAPKERVDAWEAPWLCE